MKKSILIFFLSAFAFNVYAQTAADTLKSLLTGKTKYADIESTIFNFYSNHFKGKGSGYNQWLRWLHFHRDRIEPNGDVANVSAKTQEAIAKYPIISSSNFTQSMSAWTNLGPYSYTSLANDYGWGLGRIDRIAFHPTDANTFFVGTASGGLWKTSNGGTSWYCLTEELFTPGISGIICSYADPNTLYVLTGEGEGTNGYFNYMGAGKSTGVYKSTNGGTTWTKTGQLFDDNQYIAFQLIQHPTKPNVLYAATSEGLYSTIDGGDHWVRSSNVETRDIVFNPQRPEFIYVDRVTNLKLYLMTNDTIVNPIDITDPVNSGTYVAMAVSPNQPNTVMLLVSKSAGTSGHDFKGLYKGTFTYNSTTPASSTVTFSTVITSPNILGNAADGSEAGGQAWYDMGIALKPSNANTLITCGTTVWRSTTQGTNIAAVTEYFQTASPLPYIHPDVHRVTYNPVNGYLYACTDGGIYKSTDDGTTWTDISSGLSISQFYNISGVESNPNLILGGTQDNGTFFRNTNSTNFKRVRGADGFSTAINPTNTNKIYWTENPKVFKSTDGGATNSVVLDASDGTTTDGSFPEIRLNNDYPDTIAVFNKSSLYISKNGGATWGGNTGSLFTRDFSFCGDDNKKAYAVKGDGSTSMRVCNDIFAASPVWNTKALIGAIKNYTCIETYPTYSNWIWLGAGTYSATARVIFSSNGGDNWTDFTGSLPALPINCMKVDINGTLYVGTDVGVFIRKLGDTDWTPFSNGLPRVPVTEIVINNTAGLIRVSTLGRGVWSTNLVDASFCNFSENIAGSYYGQYYFQASNNITSTSTVAGSAGTRLDLKAGSYITMNPGFLANQGSILNAAIGPCNTGIPGLQKPAGNSNKAESKKKKNIKKKSIGTNNIKK